MDTLEDLVLEEVDKVAEQSSDKVTKMLVDLFKGSILKKYKDAFDKELLDRSVHRNNLNKAIDYSFSEACLTYRGMPIDGISDEDKDNNITSFKSKLSELKDNMRLMLEINGIKVVD